MKRTVTGAGIVVALIVLWLGAQTAPAEQPDGRKPLIQMAILLDTSGSMSGLINQARTQLWTVVNEFATTRKDGQIPRLEIALYEYGKSSLPKSEGYIRRILPLTTDLDRASEELFALETNGGNEYCGMVIDRATKNLQWSGSPEDLKVVFIAGNEPFTQGPVDYREVCKAAIGRGIMVNTIHCGSEQSGVQGKWKDGAVLADGSYMCIDKDTRVVHIEAPQDKQIAELGVELNSTYVPYGAAGERGRERQAVQDKNAARNAASGAYLQRMVTKANSQYSNSHWDLVDAVREGAVKMEELDEEVLPENMRDMTPEEQKSYIQQQRRRRAEIQEEINRLNAERQKYVARKRKELGKSGEQSLDQAIINALRTQMKSKGFESE